MAFTMLQSFKSDSREQIPDHMAKIAAFAWKIVASNSPRTSHLRDSLHHSRFDTCARVELELCSRTTTRFDRSRGAGGLGPSSLRLSFLRGILRCAQDDRARLVRVAFEIPVHGPVIHRLAPVLFMYQLRRAYSSSHGCTPRRCEVE